MNRAFKKITAAVTAAAVTAAGAFDMTGKPVIAAADTHTAHKVCINSACGDTSIAEGNVCEHGEEAWTETWESTRTNSGGRFDPIYKYSTDGTYYLNSDITLTGTTTIASGQTLNLCLNGHTITVKDGSTRTPFFTVDNGGTLNLCDCKGGGQLTGTKGTSNTGAVCAYGIFNMYSGAITDNSGNYGGVYVHNYDKSAFNMYGGVISGNETTSSESSAVQCNGTFMMYGGTISNNTASDPTRGSAVSLNGEKCELYGGIISGNSTACAIQGNRPFTIYGGEIINNNGTGIFSCCSFEMRGGKVSGNIGSSYGGVNIYNPGSTLSMYGGEISGNSGVNAGGVNVSSGGAKFIMYGGSITGNSVNGKYGGGINYSSGGVLTLDGNVNISGNTGTDGCKTDLYIGTSGGTIAIGENFDLNSKVGLHIYDSPNCTSVKALAKNVTKDVRGSFFHDNPDTYYFTFDSDTLNLRRYHKLTATAENPATCTEDGNIAYWYCSSCKKYFSDSQGTNEIAQENTVASAKGHTEETIPAVEPTCTATGLTEGTKCSDCGIVLTVQESVPAKAHLWDSGVVTVPATEESEGVKTFTCTVCDTEKTEAIPMLDYIHDLAHHDKVEADCDTEGTAEYWSCSKCGNNYGDEAAENQLADTVIPALGHLWGNWTVTEAPTRTEGGNAQRICGRDGSHKEIQTLAPLTDSGVWNKTGQTNPTVNSKGREIYTSEYGTVTAPIPELSDSSVWSKEHIEPTEEIEGKDIYTSDIYGEIEVVLPKKDHVHDLKFVPEVPATETAAGIKKHWHCDGCGKDFSDENGETEIFEADLRVPYMEVKVAVAEKAPETKLNTPQSEIFEAIAEIQNVDEDADIKITLKVEDAGETVSQSDKASAEAALESLDGFEMGQFIDISLIKSVDGTDEAITETVKPLTITIRIPESISKKARYAVIRVHGGAADILEDLDNDPDTITIKTDKFSSYSLIYTENISGNEGDENSNTSENIPTITPVAPETDQKTEEKPQEESTAESADTSAAETEADASRDNSDSANSEANPSTGYIFSVIPTAISMAAVCAVNKRKKK